MGLLATTCLWLILFPMSISAGASLYLPFNTSIAFAQFNGMAGSPNFTIEFWAASTNPPHDMACALHIGVGKGGAFQDYWSVNLGDVISTLVVGIKPDVTQFGIDRDWHHYANTFGSDGLFSFYVDGELRMSQTMTLIKPFPSDPVAVCIGQEADDFLGGFDPTQAYQGYFDELRLWNVRRSQAEIRSTMRQIVPENAPGLAVQWHFDDVSNSGFATSAQGCNLTFGSAPSIPNRPCDPFDIPYRSSFVPPVWQSPVPSITIPYELGSRVRVPVCVGSNCTSDTQYSKVSLTTLPQNGNVFVSSVLIAPSALPFLLSDNSIVEYESPANPFLGDSFAYSVTFVNTGGSTQTLGIGTITIRNDTAPTTRNLRVIAKENTNSTIALPGSDAQGDPLIAVIESLPQRGQLFQVVSGKATQPITQVKTQVSNPGLGVIFAPEKNVIGSPYASFTFSIMQRNLFSSNITLSSPIARVDIELVPIDIPPEFQSTLEATTNEGASVFLDINATDAHQYPVSIVLTDPPENGTLYMDGKPITSILPASGQKEQFVDELLAFSTEYSGYWAANVVGENSRSVYGDSDQTWSASTADGNCQSLGSDIFYTEFLIVKFKIPVYAKEVHVMQNTNPGTLTRILAPRPTANISALILHNDPSQWYTLWYGPPVEFNGEQVYTITSPTLCNTPYPVNVLRLEFDTCHVTGWNEVDAIRLVGTTSAGTGHTVLPTRLEYRPWSLVTGPPKATFKFYITHCLWVSLLNSKTMEYSITVNPVNDPPTAVPPPPLAVFQNSATPIILGATDPDTDYFKLTVVLTTLPARGTLSLSPTTSTPSLAIQDRFPINATVYFFPVQSTTQPLCGTEFTDAFAYLVSDGNKTSITVGIVSIIRMNCTYCPAPFLLDAGICRKCPVGTHYEESDRACTADTTTFPSWAIAVIIVVIGAFLILVAVVFGYRTCVNARRNLNADALISTAPNGLVVMVFTDIQDSTSLWDSLPKEMSAALDIHNVIMRQAIVDNHGYEVSTSGDSFFVVFTNPADCLNYAKQVQNEMLYANWPDAILKFEGCNQTFASDGKQLLWRGLRVRMGFHLGEPTPEPNLETQKVDYFGPPVNLSARVSSKAAGGQILISENMYEWFIRQKYEGEWAMTDFGVHKLKGIERSEHIHSILPLNLRERTFPEAKDLLCLRCKGPVWCLRCDGEVLMNSSDPSPGNLKPPRKYNNSRRATSHGHRRGSASSSYLQTVRVVSHHAE